MNTRGVLPTILEECIPGRVRHRISEMCSYGIVAPDDISEIRLRVGRPSSVTNMGLNFTLEETVSSKEMADCVTSLCRGSVYAHEDTMREGYICVNGGIRVGVCGTLAPDGRGVREITSLNIRIPHVIRGAADNIIKLCYDGTGIVPTLVYSPPGVGKTTLLRDLAATLGGRLKKRVAIVDSRGEIYMEELFSDTICDVLVGYPRPKGIEIATRTLSPEAVMCDEIGDAEEARGILGAQNSGVPIIATAHASSVEGLLSRPSIHMLHEARVFSGYLGIRREKISGRLSRCFTYKYTPISEALEL